MKGDIERLLNVKLTPTQKKHQEAVVWLLDNNQSLTKAVGRTFLMAVVFIEIAIDHRGWWIGVFDHVPDCWHTRKQMFELIHSLISKSEFLVSITKFNKAEYKFKIGEVK